MGLPENDDQAALGDASTMHVRGLQAWPSGSRATVSSGHHSLDRPAVSEKMTPCAFGDAAQLMIGQFAAAQLVLQHFVEDLRWACTL
jgi:hypothetical protein